MYILRTSFIYLIEYERSFIMKKNIPFKKDILFKTKISEVTSISLEDTLELTEPDHIKGEFIVNGDYKITDGSVNRENFLYNIPFDLKLENKFNPNKTMVDIADFYYEIINNEILRVNIEVEVNGDEILNEHRPLKEDSDLVKDVKEIEAELEIVRKNLEEEPEVLEVDEERENQAFQEIETPPVAVQQPVINEEKIKSLFDSFDDKDETFSTYHVYIVRNNDTIDAIMAKYNVTKEELSLYNQIEELKVGDKIIIPAIRHE